MLHAVALPAGGTGRDGEGDWAALLLPERGGAALATLRDRLAAAGIRPAPIETRLLVADPAGPLFAALSCATRFRRAVAARVRGPPRRAGARSWTPVGSRAAAARLLAESGPRGHRPAVSSGRRALDRLADRVL